jgi:hypothetical protein
LKAIEYFAEYLVSSTELADIPADQKAVLAVVSYAVTEINSLRKLYLASDHGLQGIDVIDEMIAHQRNMLLRLWSAKLFEFSEFIKLDEIKPAIEDADVLKFAETAIGQFAALSTGRGYEAARNIRHEASNHYSFPAAKRNVRHVDTKTPLRMYIHDMTGNAYYPWGDIVMFFGRFARQSSSHKTDADRETLIEDWMNWNLRATEWIDGVAVQAFRFFVIDRFPEKSADRRAYWIDPILVADTTERRTAILLRKSSP